MSNDKIAEMERYDERACAQLVDDSKVISVNDIGIETIAPIHQAPYLYYTHLISGQINENHHVLEIGSGSGMHTHELAKTKAYVTATDISPNSLKILKKRLVTFGDKLQVKVADMESLPFENDTFDAITCAGSLSYGDPVKVNKEIERVLRPNGMLICVDSLNHNPIYRFNRFLQVIKGVRTKSTSQRIPTIKRLSEMTKNFEVVKIQYFGAITFIVPLLGKVIGQKKARSFSTFFDKKINTRYSAFKFVLLARQLRK